MRNRLLLAAALALLAAWSAPAMAQLNATFIGNSARACVASGAGFDGNLALRGGAGINSGVDVRYVTLRMDGTGTTHGKSLSISHGAVGTGSTPATEFEVDCTFNYSADFTQGLLNIHNLSCISTVLNGPAAGQQTENTLTTVRQFALYGDTLVLQNTDPDVETLRNLTTGAVTERICHYYGRRVMTQLPAPNTD
jgi:hypothetical protein